MISFSDLTSSQRALLTVGGVVVGLVVGILLAASQFDLSVVTTLQTERLTTIVARGEPTAETLRAVCVDVIETSVDFLLEGTVFFRSAHMLSAPRQQEVTRRRRAYHDTFAGIVERGQAEGLYRTDIPVAVLVAHFFSDVHYLSHWYKPEGPEDKTVLAHQLTDLFLVSIAASSASASPLTSTVTAPAGATASAEG